MNWIVCVNWLNVSCFRTWQLKNYFSSVSASASPSPSPSSSASSSSSSFMQRCIKFHKYWINFRLKTLTWRLTLLRFPYSFLLVNFQCCGSVLFWYGSGSSNPFRRITDPDPAPDPTKNWENTNVLYSCD